MCRYLPVLWISVLLSGHMIFAQVTTGTISGVAQDASGAVIPGVSVTVKNVDTGTTRTVTTDERGRYIAPDLPLGSYEVEAPDLWYDPCAFSLPKPGTYGNVGRNTLTGPGFDDIDASLVKTFKPSGEQLSVQLRAGVFNLFDHANFYAPAFNVFSGSAGHVTRLVSTPGGRLIQLAVKITF